MNETNKKDVQEKKAPAKPVPAPTATKASTLVYCGPAYKGVAQYETFSGELSQEVQLLKNYSKDFETLLVPLSELAETKQRIAISGSLENKAYQSLLGGNQ